MLNVPTITALSGPTQKGGQVADGLEKSDGGYSNESRG